MASFSSPAISTREYLTSRWAETLRLVGSEGAKPEVFEEIFLRYSDSSRYYHITEHLRSGFEVLDRYLKSRTSSEIELAFWYHDFEYNTQAIDNELRSASAASDRITKSLQLPLNFAIGVGKLILATKHSSEPSTSDAKVLVDMDLSILGEDPKVFDTYEENIRKEYSWVDDLTFKRGRQEVLQRFLKPIIYYTPELRSSSYEFRAKSNLERSISRLSA
jgi:predicted metal-dependent HD superfamily phosphohydrolase